MPTKLRAPNPVYSEALSFPLWIDSQHFVAAAAETYTVPTSINLILFVAQGSGFWVNANGAAVVPVGDTADGTSSAYIPQNASVLLEVYPGEPISILPDTVATCNLNMWCYSRRQGA